MQYHASSAEHEDPELTSPSVTERDATSDDDGPGESGGALAPRTVEEPPPTWESGGSPDEVPEAWDRFPRTRRLETWKAEEDERLEDDRQMTRGRVDALDRFVRAGSKRLLGDDPSPAWAIIVGAMVIAAWDAARRLSGVPEMCVAEMRGGSAFGSVGAALGFAVYNEAVLGVGPSLVVAQDRDEDWLARTRASRSGAEFVTARTVRRPHTGRTKSQDLVELRCDVLRAISASKVGVVDLALVVQADVGVWRPAGTQAAERAVLDYVRWRLGTELSERTGGEGARPARAPAAVARRAEAAQVDDAVRRSAASARGCLERLPPTLARVPGALMRELGRRWGRSRAQLEREAIEWRAANPAGPVELVRLKPAEIAKRLAFLASDGRGAETITPQAIGRRIANSRRALIKELASRGLVPRPPARRPPTRESAPVEGYIPFQVRWQR